VLAPDLAEGDRFDALEAPPASGWRAFARGTVAELRAVGIDVPGARIEIVGDVPIGAGLSSSGALGVSLCLALIAVSGAAPPPRIELARLCSRIENEWVGAQTGLLDQLAALHGRGSHALRLDIRELEVLAVPLELEGWALATLDSGASRANASSGYNRRREECRAACEALGVPSLRAVDRERLTELPPPLARRARHVLSENERVERMVATLERRRFQDAGALLDESHASLRDDYEVSVPEVEEAIARTKRAGAVGARIHGGGFGGHVLALFPPGAEPPAGALEVRAGPGARLL
jgi:galactokinase